MLHAHFGGAATVEPLPPGPGRRNDLFRAEVRRRACFIKVRNRPGEDAVREAWALSHLSPKLGPTPLLTPPIARPPRSRRAVRSDPGEAAILERCLVMSQVPGRPVTSALAGRLLPAAARTIAALHAVRPRRGPPLACPSDPPSLFALATELFAEVVRRDVLAPPYQPAVAHALDAARAHVERLDPALWRRPVRALCHGDLAWHNMHHHRGVVRLVDFELAGLGDPVIDLALFVSRNPLGTKQEQQLLGAYHPHRQDRGWKERYSAIVPLVALVSALNSLRALDEEAQRGEAEAGLPEGALLRVARRAAKELKRALERLAPPGS